jgi:signal transduction histidine kinase/ActR/RegA family two-component response regulator
MAAQGGGSHQDARTQVAMRTVLSVAARLHGGTGADSLLESVTRYAREITRAERACVVVTNQDGQSVVRVASGIGDQPINLEQISTSVINRVIKSRAPLLVHDVYGDTELMARPSIATLSLRSALCVPMLREAKLLGVLYADSAATAGCFDRVDLEVLSLFAEQAAGALEASRLLADVQKSYAELKGMQERLIRGERLRVMGEMTSGVAHEFNNLLTAILARIQLVGLEFLAPEIREHLRLIERAALDAAGVVRRLQSFSRASQRANFARVDMYDVCSDVIELLRPLWSTRRRQGKAPIAVRLRGERGCFVDGDPTELREVLTNLVKNSLDALERGGSITVSTTREREVVRVSVADDGPGIPSELLTKVFTPFFTTKGERGTGLGLCLAQQIVERHGGDIRLESAPSRGTEALLQLPRASASGIANRASESPPRTANSEGVRVLVVDDDPDVLQPLLAFLTRSGFAASAASSASDGLSRLASAPADVLVSDISMPGMDGIEFAQKVRSLYPETAIILMSGRASEVDPDRLARMGGVTLLAKPFTLRQVVELVNSLASSAASRGQ